MTNAQDALVDIGFSTKEARQVLPSLFLYLFRAFPQKELYRRAGLVNSDVNLFKLMPKIPLMGEITLHDKVCLFALLHGEEPGVKPNRYIKSVLLKNQELCDHLRQFDDMPPITVQQAQALESRALLNREVATYINKFVYRKMSFIVQNYGVSKSDLICSLHERAIHNLRINFPNWKTSGEMMAMCKSAIANAGHNLIKFYAAEKRALVNRSNMAVTVSLDSIIDMAGDAPEYQALVISGSLDVAIADVESRISVERLINKFDGKPGKQLFLKLLSGKFDSGFSDFIGVDCTHYADYMDFDDLLDATCRYMNLPMEAANTFLQSLREG